MRKWSIEVWLLDDQGNEVLPTVFEKCTYNLHPTFERNKQGTHTPRITSHGARWTDQGFSFQEAAVSDRREGLG